MPICNHHCIVMQWLVLLFFLEPSLGFQLQPKISRSTFTGSSRNIDDEQTDNGGTGIATRRNFLGSVVSGTALIAAAPSIALAFGSPTTPAADVDLWWQKDPVNKRTGTTVSDAEKAGYNLAFVTYLSRFLLNFDKDCQRWWFSQSKNLPLGAQADEINELRLAKFGAFSASVEVGLQEYKGPNGPDELLQSLLKRYSNTTATNTNAAKSTNTADNTNNNAESVNRQKRLRRESKEARRQLALLFGLLAPATQPVQSITKLLAAVDNGSVQSVDLVTDKTASGYAATDDPPQVIFPPPQAGENYERALAKAVMEPTGQILRIDIGTTSSTKNDDVKYDVPPQVQVSAPTAKNGTTAVLKAKLTKSGRLERISVVDPGTGYGLDDSIRVQLVSNDGTSSGSSIDDSGVVLSPVLEVAVSKLEIVRAGSGYAVEKPLKVSVQAPPPAILKQKSSTTNSTTTTAPKQIVVGSAIPRAEKDSYTTFRRDGDTKKVRDFEDALAKKYDYYNDNKQTPASDNTSSRSRVSGTVSGPDSSLPPRPFWGGKSSSSQLLDLLPDGVGLEYDTKVKAYHLAVDTIFKNAYPGFLQQSSNRPLNPDFGPRGRSPIERNMELGLDTYLRFALSGAICASGVHLALVPIDVAKTKMQTNPVKYPSIGKSFGTIFKEEGVSTFFTGWVPTAAGNFLTGGVLYAVTELIRQSLTESAGADAMSLEVPIILAAAGCASFLGSFIMCPFEAVRIRSVAQPDFADNVAGVVSRMVKEEGAFSLINAIPVFLVKNIPYAMAKFTIFDISTERLYEAFPAAHDDLKLSLAITLIGGVLGGFGAAIISNPADAVISEMKKDKTKKSPQEAVEIMLERAGVSSLFKGLPLRMVFYSLIASLQFLVYDGVRFALGVGSDDLRLYLDVLGGALRDSGN